MAEKHHVARHQSDDKHVIFARRFVQQEGVSSVSWTEPFSASIDNTDGVSGILLRAEMAHSSAV